MSLTWLFARRYLLSRKSTNAINIISLIAALAMGVGTMSLILVLSVFNGFESLVVSLYNVFYPEIVILPAQGKTFEIQNLPLKKINAIPGVKATSTVILENALVEYNDKQSVVTIKGVDSNYTKVVSGLDSFIIAGSPVLTQNEQPFALVGAGIAYNLGINPENVFYSLNVYLPVKDAAMGSLPEQAFVRQPILPGGVFSVQQEFDTRYIIVPTTFMSDLGVRTNIASQVEVALEKDEDIIAAKRTIQSLVGQGFVVKDRWQQNETLYKVMKTEKWVVFAVLLFIIIVSSFNIIGALSMLVIEKQNDMAVMLAMGASPGLIKRIFLAEGCLMAGSGALIGMGLAVTLCLLQQHIGLVPMPGKTFLVKYYPVNMQLSDFVWVSFAVFIISLIASWAPASRVATQAQQVISSMKRA